MTTTAHVRDVTLRDGLQLTGSLMPVQDKVEVIRTLLAIGVDDLEIGSMARPDLVPPLANTLEVVAALTEEELSHCTIWVATPRNVERAVAAGVTRLQYCLSVSDTHNRANIGRSTEDSMEALPRALEIADAAGASLQFCLATSFTCPFEGVIAPERTLALVADPRAQGTTETVICDTLGQADPAEVSSLVRETAALRSEGVIFHGHDTWGMGVANSLAAVASGAGTVDGALGGLGGCPFAPGAAGNTSTEDLLFALKPEWLDPEGFSTLVDLGARVTGELGERNMAKSTQGAHSTATAFPWVVPPRS